MAKNDRLLLKIFKNRRHSWIGHTVRHNEFVVNFLAGAIFGKKAAGRPRLQYLKQVVRNRGADSYTAMKWMAFNKSSWKAANQSKDWVIRRGKAVLFIYIFFNCSLYNHAILRKAESYNENSYDLFQIKISIYHAGPDSSGSA